MIIEQYFLASCNNSQSALHYFNKFEVLMIFLHMVDTINNENENMIQLEYQMKEAPYKYFIANCNNLQSALQYFNKL